VILKTKQGLSQKLKAGSIFYALIVMILVGIISTAMITLTFSNKFLEERDNLKERLLRNVNSGIQLLMAEEEAHLEPFVVDLFGENLDSVRLEKKEWGLFSVALSRAFHQTSREQLVFDQAIQLGAIPKPRGQAAIYLEDNDKPLIITGDTYIEGKAYLPKAGIKKGSMKGVGYTGNTLINGTIEISEQALPAVSKQKIKYLLNQFDQFGNQAIEDALQQSFHQETLLIKEEVLILEDQILKGNIILASDSLVYIGKNVVLEDVLIFAPYILIEDGFRGNVQAFATRLLDVGEEVKLLYPSVLGLIKDEDLPKEPKLIIGAGSAVTGLVFVRNEFFNKKYPSLEIQEGAVVEGQVFAECSVELQGDIYGNISCKSFFLRYGSSSYRNHLLDVEINASKRSEDYLSPQFMTDKYTKPGIVKYLK